MTKELDNVENIEEIEQEPLPTVYKLSENENGAFEKYGKRYDLLSCHICESKETYETGEYNTITDEEGNEVRVPITKQRVVINKGWLEFNSLDDAIKYFCLIKVVDEKDKNNI